MSKPTKKEMMIRDMNSAMINFGERQKYLGKDLGDYEEKCAALVAKAESLPESFFDSLDASLSGQKIAMAVSAA